MTWKKSVCVFAFGGLGMAAGCRSVEPAPHIVMPTAMATGTPITMMPVGGIPASPSTTPLMPRAADSPSVLPAPKPESPADKYPRAVAEPKFSDGPDLPPVLPPKDLVGLLPMPKPESAAAAPAVPIPKSANEPALVSVPKNSVPLIVPPTVHASRPVEQPNSLARTPTEKFGHGPDYRWVAGALDRHARGGFWTIRYADGSTDDRWGGKVRLIDDSRMRDFQDGDIVYVEGELLAPASAADGPTAFPPFRVMSIRLVEKAK